MKEDEVVADYFNRVQVVVNNMRTNGELITELMVIEKIHRTLTQRNNQIMVAIEESKDLYKMKVKDLHGSLEAHELRALQAQGSKQTSQGDVKHKKGKGKFKWYKKYDSDEGDGNSRNQNISDNNIKNSNGKKKFNKKGIQCYNCKKWEHFANECISKKVQRENAEAQMAADDSDSYKVLLKATTKSDNDCPEQWYLDTSSSNHLIGHKDWFVSIDEKVKRENKFADNSSITEE
ncbi:uncharacterized protein [Cicer arietinum]|uniref:Uncharacterized protein LOC101488242 n=1 Tax=Cicer arietinum TaxID=3827 RepID=A0A1S2YU43_CICAR|nr:uncharacterized protein LOC101488242 [Cicer arietinum]